MNGESNGVRLTDEQRLDWLRLMRTENVGPRGIRAQTPQALQKSRGTSKPTVKTEKSPFPFKECGFTRKSPLEDG
ncbi:MAG: hypothetical protein WCI56_13330 [Hyphomicrobiales bacterium]